VDSLLGVHAVVESHELGGTAESRARAATRYVADVDFCLVADQRPEWRVPALAHAEQLRGFPVAIGIADGLLVEVGATVESQRRTLTLFDHGVRLDDFDWTTLPRMKQ
jgi:hypothetical protein